MYDLRAVEDIVFGEGRYHFVYVSSLRLLKQT